MRAGPIGMLSQNLILMGVFFTVPLYLQLVLGFDALETGIRLLPVSIAMLLASALARALVPVLGPVDHPRRPGDHRHRHGDPARHDPARPAGRPSPCRWRCSESGWGSSFRSSATSFSRPSRRRAGARPAASSSPGSSSARRWGRAHRGDRADRAHGVFLSNIESNRPSATRSHRRSAPPPGPASTSSRPRTSRPRRRRPVSTRRPPPRSSTTTRTRSSCR